MNFTKKITNFRKDFEKFDYQLKGEQEIIKKEFLEEILSYKRELNDNEIFYDNLIYSESLNDIVFSFRLNISINREKIVKGIKNKIFSINEARNYSESYSRLKTRKRCDFHYLRKSDVSPWKLLRKGKEDRKSVV